MHFQKAAPALLLIWLFSSASIQAAVQINWILPGPGGASGFNHTLSDGSALQDGYTLQIGSFDNGFIPTSENVSNWNSNWRSLSTGKFKNPSGFAEPFTTTLSPANFPSGRQLYVYGYQQIDTNTAEIVLVTDPNWKMPSQNPLPTTLLVDINLASTFVVGTANIAEVTSIQTVAVQTNKAPPLYYSEWVLRHFDGANLSNTSISGSLADPDGDGIENKLEYFTGNDPTVWNANPLSIEPTTTGDLRLTSPFRTSAHVEWKLRHSIDLVQWVDAAEQPSANVILEILELQHTPNEPKEFWQLQLLTVDP